VSEIVLWPPMGVPPMGAVLSETTPGWSDVDKARYCGFVDARGYVNVEAFLRVMEST
jgi:hypothetical protein